MTPKLPARNYAFVNESLITASLSLFLFFPLFLMDADYKSTAISSEEEGDRGCKPG